MKTNTHANIHQVKPRYLLILDQVDFKKDNITSIKISL